MMRNRHSDSLQAYIAITNTAQHIDVDDIRRLPGACAANYTDFMAALNVTRDALKHKRQLRTVAHLQSSDIAGIQGAGFHFIQDQLTDTFFMLIAPRGGQDFGGFVAAMDAGASDGVVAMYDWMRSTLVKRAWNCVSCVNM